MLKKIVIIVGLAFCLQGCIPAALVVGATAGGAVVYGKRSPKTILRDNNITYEAQARVNQNPQLKGKTHIVVTTYSGVVLMAGQAPTAEMRDLAYQLVSTTPYVKRVYNEVTIAPPTSLGRRSDDTWITTKIKSNMLAKKGVPSTRIHVLTEDGVVYLMGIVSPQQATLASDVARRVRGVRKVVTLFEYIK